MTEMEKVLAFLLKITIVLALTFLIFYDEKVPTAENDEVKENYYLSICTAENASQLIDENGNIWVADLELIPNSRYAVMFTDNGTREITDDLIVEFKLIHE